MVEKYLYEWFLEEDHLLVPELGRFDSRYVGASLEPSVNKALPPNKQITFDASIRSDDGVFAQYIAERANVSNEEAQQAIKVFVTQVKAELGIKQHYDIPSFGHLMLSPGDQLLFEPNKEVNYLGDSFGLPDVYNLKLVPSSNGADYEAQAQDTEVLDPPYEPKTTTEEEDIAFEKEVVDTSTRRLMTLVTVVLLVLVSFTAYFLITDQNPFYFASTSKPPVQEEEDTGIGEEETDDLEGTSSGLDDPDETSAGGDNSSGPPTDEEELPPLVDYPTNSNYINRFVYNPSPPANLSQVLIKNKSSRFYVIVGSFDEPGNAYSFYNNLINRGVGTAKIIAPNSSNSRYRVSYADYSSKMEAREQGKSFGKANSISLWVLAY